MTGDVDNDVLHNDGTTITDYILNLDNNVWGVVSILFAQSE